MVEAKSTEEGLDALLGAVGLINMMNRQMIQFLFCFNLLNQDVKSKDGQLAYKGTAPLSPN